MVSHLHTGFRVRDYYHWKADYAASAAQRKA